MTTSSKDPRQIEAEVSKAEADALKAHADARKAAADAAAERITLPQEVPDGGSSSVGSLHISRLRTLRVFAPVRYARERS